MQINGGTVIIVLALLLCAAVAIYFTVRSYLWSRQDHTRRPEDKPADSSSKGKKDKDAKAPPSSS
jgi:hypothetical protein